MFLEVQWADHQVLRNLRLDFRKPDGSPYRTIVIAGENGTGKTSILTSINDLMMGKPTPTLDHATYEHNGCLYSSMPDRKNPNYGFYYRKNLETGEEQYFHIDDHHFNSNANDDEAELRHYGCIYLSARSGFKTSPIKSSTTKQLDTEKSGEDGNFDYTEIKQLIVDLDGQDAQEYRIKTEKAIDQEGFASKENSSEIKNKSRMHKFINAFDGFFDCKLKFRDIDYNNPNEKVIRFAKGNKQISIDDLSTGEKQIVFRGAYCLRNNGKLKNGLVLIDEPELSMHPKWQRKILQYYRNLFTDNGEQTVQMIITTHSDHVVSEALANKDDVKVIILKEDNNAVIAHDIGECVLPRIQSSEVNYIAFGIPTLDYFLALYCRVQEIAAESDYKDTVNGCDEFIADSTLYDSSMSKDDKYRGTPYKTLPTYIRNAICHPNSPRSIKDTDVERCIEFLRRMCESHKHETDSESTQ